MEYTPSEYQEDIFEFIKYGYGNAVISAMAGSGKSTTIIEALNYIKSNKKILFLAFNNSIVDELNKKIKRNGTDIKTLHSLGLSVLRWNYKDKNLVINENKYHNRLIEVLEDSFSDFSTNQKYIKNIIKLCDLGRFYLIKTKNELLEVSNKYSLILLDDELDVAKNLIEWGKNSLENTNDIDYTDMVYLPSVLNVKVMKYDFVIIDEAQDLSISQMTLFRKCLKQGSRFIAVGDEKQTIYGFSGSCSDSFKKLKNISNTIELPLSICYRCPKEIVKFAQHIVPEIKYHDNAIDGEICFKSKIDDLKNGDMVICRNTLPLLKLYIKLTNNKIDCYLKGSDVGTNLLYLIQDINHEKLSDVLEYLNNSIQLYIDKNKSLMNLSDSEILLTQEYNYLVEKIECLKILSNDLDYKTELINKIKSTFSDEKKTGICLSTIHKAKGLEADNVYILNKNLTPSKFAKQDWEIEQEINLEYVSYTRAKKKLGFIFE